MVNKNNTKILITGAKGQLGREVARELENKRVNYLALDRGKLDITDFEKVNEAIRNFKPDFVINCAAYNNVDKAEQNWQKAFLINGIAVKNLALACNKVEATFVHYSSDYIFDGKKNSPYTIIDAPSPISKYGESKFLGERAVQNFGEKYYLIRLSWVFGKNPEASFPLKLIKWAKKNKSLKIVEDQISSPSYVKDVARATLDLIDSGQYGLYHITNKGFCSRYEWAKYILEILKWKGKLIPAESEEFNILAERPKFSALDSFPLKYIINYELPPWQDATDRFLKEI